MRPEYTLAWARRVSPARSCGRVAYTPVRSRGRGACRLRGLWHLRRFAVVNVQFYGKIYDNVQKT